MKYVLSQEEFDELTQKNIKAAQALKDTLQDLCTRVADSEPVKDGWYAGKPWGCILTVDHEWYCDDCPVQDVCPKDFKEWSQ